MASADEYRDYAEQCVALASKSSNPGDKARLLQMAQTWRDLAAKDDAIQNKSAGKDQDINIRRFVARPRRKPCAVLGNV